MTLWIKALVRRIAGLRPGRIKMLVAVILCVAAARPITAGGAVLIYEGDYYGDDEDETEYRRESSRSNYSGPGIVGNTDDEVKSQGPTVKTVTLSESYHEEFGVYEESLNDQFFIYSNVSNGGITDRQVTVDIPANVSYVMELNGQEIPYVSGQPLGERGTYVLRMSVVINPSAPLSKQEEYNSTFRFRIQEKLPESQRTDGGEISPDGTLTVNGSDGIGWGQSGISGTGNNGGGNSQESFGSGIVNGINGLIGGGRTDTGESGTAAESEADAETTAAEEGESIPEESEDAEDKTGTGETGGPEEASDETAASDEPAEPQEASAPAGGNFTGGIREQSYIPDKKCYLVTMDNGRDFISSVPSGYIGPGPVELILAEDEECSLYRNDEQIEYIRGNSQVDAGAYRISLDGQEFSFVIASSVSRMDLYPAPLGMTFGQVYLNEEPIKLVSDQYVSMNQDGTYRFVLEGEDGQKLEFILKKDTEAPVVAVSVKGGTASIQYLSDDISSITLEKNGEVVNGFSGYQVNKPGTYRLLAADQAGNVGTARFTLRYQINRYGVAAVVLILLTVAGAVVFTIHVKRTIKIR